MRVDIYESESNPAKKLIVPAGTRVDDRFEIDTTDPDYGRIRLAHRNVELRGGKKHQRHLNIDPERIPDIVDQIAGGGYALATLPVD
jgi:hypothetical protein